MEVLKLLKTQNRCLEKFRSHSEDFLRKANQGDFSDLTPFQKHRETILKALSLYDRKLSELISQLLPSERTPDLIATVQKILELKHNLIHSILVIDQQIINQIEQEKKRLITELSTSDKNNQLVRKFKSKWISEPGETLDGKI
jgi:hypothetical protein